jgi:uncharacterized protein (DUF1697 family)
MPTLIAFLRGINLAKQRRIAMAELREALEEAGFENVKTQGQSGNVVLESDDKPAAAEKKIAKVIAKRFDMDVGVVARTPKELAAILDGSPLAKEATDPTYHLVAFLGEKPPAAKLEPLTGKDFGSEQIAAKGREIYLWCADGQRGSALMKAFGKADLGVLVTVRNFNTVAKVNDIALSRGP